MNLIHEPNGHAREYSPLALTIYFNCDHNCAYCNNRKRESSLVIPGYVRAKDRFREQLVAELFRQPVTRQVLAGYPGDPYCNAEMMQGHARFALDRLNEHQVPTAILTKGGTRALRDLNRFTSMHCKVGAALTFDNAADSIAWEPGAAIPRERIAMLERLNQAGVRTWARLEPVIDPAQTLVLIDRTHAFVDEYRVGRLDNSRGSHVIDWRRFTGEAVQKLRGYGKAFYISRNLQCFACGLTVAERNPDHLALTMETADCA